jgi:hypothetical protein
MIFKFKAILLLLLFLLGFNVCAQTSIAENLDSLQANPTKYLTPMQYAFMFHEDTPWMIKGSLNSSIFTGNSSISDSRLGEIPIGVLPTIGFERRIKGALTANISANYTDAQYKSSVNTSLRYYYTMKARKEKENIPFNLSGNYVEGGVDFSFYRQQEGFYRYQPGKDFKWIENTNLHTTYFLKWGMQRRYLKNGFVDIGFMASYNQDRDFFVLEDYSNVRLNSTTSLGIAFAKDKTNLNKGKLCSVTKCYEEQKSAWKINFSELFGVILNKYIAIAILEPEINYERKIKESIFSINNTARLSLGLNATTRRTEVTYGGEYTLETRMFYNLRRRIQKGKTGNGLSANYISIGAFNEYVNNNYENLYGLGGAQSVVLQLQVATGIQRFIGDHFYYDVGLAYRPNKLNVYETSQREVQFNSGIGVYGTNGVEFSLYSKVGYRF